MSGGRSTRGPRAADILLLYHRPIGLPDAATVKEHISAFGRHSDFGILGVNTAAGFPSRLLKMGFPAILLHYSLFGGSNYAIPRNCLDYLATSRKSYKIAFFQDEYFACRKRAEFVEDYAIDCIYSLLEPGPAVAVYGALAHAPKLVYTLPGYVSADLVAAARRWGRPDARRAVDVGYRARELPPFMGREAREKTAIAEGFTRRAAGLGLHLDVETAEARRLYGRMWYRFLGNCRACLGVEAGVSVFDLEGVVYDAYRKLNAVYPHASLGEMLELLSPVMAPWENRIYYRTISPRHFESAAFRVCQVLFEGRYSGILRPGSHYIPLRKDFSNLDDVVRAVRDAGMRHRVTETAYDDLIASGSYSYERFVHSFDAELRGVGLLPRVGRGLTWADGVATRTQMLPPGGRALAASLIKRVARARFPGRRTIAFFLRPIVRAVLRWRRRRDILPRTEA